MKDKEQGRKEYIKEIYQEQIIIERKIKELLQRYAEIEILLYWFADDEDIYKLAFKLNLTNKN